MTKFIASNVDIILTFSIPGCLAAKRATTIIPIVFATSSDPLGTGIVASLGHPGGNITGLSVMATELSAKRLELLQVVVPSIRNIAVLWDQPRHGTAGARNQARGRAVEGGFSGFRRPRS
jgi:putative tryptophan/tyrosine transport system substrate-binding protein